MLGRESASVLGELGAVPLSAERLRESLKGIGELFERLAPWNTLFFSWRSIQGLEQRNKTKTPDPLPSMPCHLPAGR